MTTTGQWLAHREPTPPGRLVSRLGELLDAQSPAAITPEVLLQVSAGVLTHLVRDGQTARGSALELLAADALATYAFEAAAEDPAALDETCARAMRLLSGVVDAA